MLRTSSCNSREVRNFVVVFVARKAILLNALISGEATSTNFLIAQKTSFIYTRDVSESFCREHVPKQSSKIQMCGHDPTCLAVCTEAPTTTIFTVFK